MGKILHNVVETPFPEYPPSSEREYPPLEYSPPLARNSPGLLNTTLVGGKFNIL